MSCLLVKLKDRKDSVGENVQSEATLEGLWKNISVSRGEYIPKLHHLLQFAPIVK